MTLRDPEFDAISEKEIFEEARDRLDICEQAESVDREKGKADISFREGEQWDDNVSPVATTASMEEIELTINLTDALCQRVENNIKQQRPRGKCHPVGDGADIEISDILNGLGRHVEARSEASVAYDQGGRSAITNGWGYFRLIAEWEHPRSFRKEMRILPIRNVFTVYMDPSAIMPSGSDAWWCELSVLMKRAEYKSRYPRASNAEWQPAARGDSTQKWENKEDIRLAEYFRIREVPEKLYRLRHGQDEFTLYHSELPLTDARDIDVREVKAKGVVIDGDRESVRRRVEWFRLNGVKVVEREIVPGTWIPVFRVQGNVADVDGQVTRRGMVRGMTDPQRMVNYGEVAKIKRLGLAPKAPWIGAEGQFDGHPEWDNANTQSYSMLTYKPVTVQTAQGEIPLPPPQRQPPAQIEAGFSEFVQGMRTNLLSVAGMPNEPGADQQGVVVSGRAIQRRQYLSDQSHFHYYDNVTLAIAQCWRVMAEWFPVYYGEPGRMQRIIGEDSTPQMVKLNERVTEQTPDGAIERIRNDITVGRYDVVMDTGPGYETKREEGAETLIELLKIQALAELIAKVGPDLVFRSIDHPYMQELADRLMAQTPEGLQKILEGLPERAKSIIQSMAKQNEQLQQALQAAQQEVKFGVTKAHLAAATKAHDTEVRAETARHDTQIKAETARFDTTVKAHTAMAVEEIKAGASLMNTHVEAEHHAREAERMLEHAESAEES